MDGGRVLRAFLSLIIPYATATHIAVGIGKAIALIFAIFGIAVLRDWTLPLVAVFIFVGAHFEGRTVSLEESLRRIHVGQCFMWEAGGVGPNDPLSMAMRGGPRDLAVTQYGRVIGVLWKIDIMNALRTRGAHVPVYEVMDCYPPIVDVNTSLYIAQQAMLRANRGAVLVTERGLYRGILTAERYWQLYRGVQRGRREKGNARYWGWLTNWLRQWRREEKVLSAIGRKPAG